MDLSMRPLVPFYGRKASGNGITFIGREQEVHIEVPGYEDELGRITSACNGLRTATELRQFLSDIPINEIDAIVDILFKSGVAIDVDELQYQFHLDSANPPTLATRTITNEEIDALVNHRKALPTIGKRYPLQLPESRIIDICQRRKSTRSFKAGGIPFTQLCGILRAMYTIGSQRAVASAGQLYPLELFILIINPEQGPGVGLYQYDPSDPGLISIARQITSEQLIHSLGTRTAERASVAIVVAAQLDRLAAKYGNRGYRYALIETGHATQNAALFCAEQGLGMVEIGGYNDEYLAQLIGLDYPRTAPTLALLIGNIDESELEPDNTATTDRSLRDSLVGSGKPIEWVTSKRLRDGEYSPPGIGVLAKYRTPATNGRAVMKNSDCLGFGYSPIVEEASIKAIAEAYERHASSLIRCDIVSTANKLEIEWFDPRLNTPLQPEAYDRYNCLQPFDPDTELQWTLGTRLSTGASVAIPVEHVYYPLRASQINRRPCYASNSNGVAAHTDRAIAIEKGLFELIERDAIVATWYGKRIVYRLPDTYITPSIELRVNHWRDRGWEVSFLNLTLDSVPVVMAVAHSSSKHPSLTVGAAAASDYTLACNKAWDEAETMLLNWRRRKPRQYIMPEAVRSPMDHGKLYFNPANLSRLEWLLSATTQIPVPQNAHNSFELFDPIVCDLTPSENNGCIQVFRVISEKLLPISFGYGTEHVNHPRMARLGIEWKQEVPSFPHFFA